MSYRLSAKRKSLNQIQVKSIPIEIPVKVDYSRACFICGTLLTSIVGFCKHRKFQHCSNHYQKLLTTQSTGGSSFPDHMNAVVRDSRENYLSEADSYDEVDYKLLTKYVEETGLRSISKFSIVLSVMLFWQGMFRLDIMWIFPWLSFYLIFPIWLQLQREELL